MSRSTFNGPVLIGLDDAPTFTSGVGEANFSSRPGPNWGFVNMVQSAPITQQTADTYPTYQKAADGTPGATNVPQMVIPGKSIITRISVLVTTAWEGDGAGPGIDIGSGWGNLSDTPPGTDKDIFVQAWDLDNLGMNVISPTGAFVTGGFENWMNLSSVQQGDSVVGQDRFIALDSEQNGDGVGVLTINYCQAVDLSAIA